MTSGDLTRGPRRKACPVCLRPTAFDWGGRGVTICAPPPTQGGEVVEVTCAGAPSGRRGEELEGVIFRSDSVGSTVGVTILDRRIRPEAWARMYARGRGPWWRSIRQAVSSWLDLEGADRWGLTGTLYTPTEPLSWADGSPPGEWAIAPRAFLLAQQDGSPPPREVAVRFGLPWVVYGRVEVEVVLHRPPKTAILMPPRVVWTEEVPGGIAEQRPEERRAEQERYLRELNEALARRRKPVVYAVSEQT